MSNVVSWSLHLTVRDNRLDDFRSLMEEMVESTRSEPGALIYEWFLSEDTKECHLHERYRDDEAVMVHLGNFGSKFADRFMACVEPTAFNVYGNPSEEARAVFNSFGAAFLGTFGGFAR